MGRSLSILLAFVLLPYARTLADESAITWHPWSDAVFAQAKSQGRFVLLDLGTAWCHWCHVMEEVTYRDPAVIGLVGKRYFAVRVDADSRPDLSNRYEDGYVDHLTLPGHLALIECAHDRAEGIGAGQHIGDVDAAIIRPPRSPW